MKKKKNKILETRDQNNKEKQMKADDY